MSARETGEAIRVAALQYGISFLADWRAYAAKIDALVAEAAAAGAGLLTFPEYASMELASLLPASERATLAQQLAGVQTFAGDFAALFEAAAKRHGVYILAPSFPLRDPGGKMCNRAWFFGPGGAAPGETAAGAYCEKNRMTRFEAEIWGIAPGDGPSVFETRLGRVGVAICYDCEFPNLVRPLVEAGARIVLVPSCTDALAGYHRVRIACRARALENQCFVVMAPLVGEAPWSEAVDVNVGAAGIFGPVDRGFPDDGVISEGTLNRPGWIYGDLDSKALERVRAGGQVFNHRDWVGAAPVPAAEAMRIVTL